MEHKSIEKELTCKCTGKGYEDPYVLFPCGHSVEKCFLDRILLNYVKGSEKKSKQKLCPECGQFIQEYTKNISLRNICDRFFNRKIVVFDDEEIFIPSAEVVTKPFTSSDISADIEKFQKLLDAKQRTTSPKVHISKQRKTYECKLCKKPGHNARTCMENNIVQSHVAEMSGEWQVKKRKLVENCS